MARVRSPNYPALSLPDAVARVRGVHKAQQTTAEPRDIVVKHMGYTSVNGRALKSLSALIKYGLLVGSDKDGLKVSERALAILFPENMEAKNSALLAAAREPALYAEIFDRWEARPSEDSLNGYLVRNGFNMNAVEAVARAFYETYDFVSGIENPYDSDDREPEGAVEDTESNASDQPAMQYKQMRQPPSQKPSGELALNSTKPIFDFETVRIETVIDNIDDLVELIARLEQIKNMLPPKSSD